MVYFLQSVAPNFDIQSASNFGEVQYIFAEGEGRCSVFSTEAYCDEIANKMQDFGFSNKDFFALTGGVVAVSLALAVMVQEFPQVDVLIYSVRDGGYVHRIIRGYDE